MNLPNPTPTRKQRFEAALKLAGMTTEQWCVDYHVVSRHHLNECFRGNRDFGPELSAAIDRFIGQYLPDVAVQDDPEPMQARGVAGGGRDDVGIPRD